MQDGVDGIGGDFIAAFEAGEFDEDGDADEFAAEVFDEFDAGFHGSAGGEDVVDEEDALAFDDGVGMDFEGVGAIFEVVSFGDSFVGELAGFADETEARGEAAGDGGAEDEAAAFGADDHADIFAAVGIGHEFDG